MNHAEVWQEKLNGYQGIKHFKELFTEMRSVAVHEEVGERRPDWFYGAEAGEEELNPLPKVMTYFFEDMSFLELTTTRKTYHDCALCSITGEYMTVIEPYRDNPETLQ